MLEFSKVQPEGSAETSCIGIVEVEGQTTKDPKKESLGNLIAQCRRPGPTNCGNRLCVCRQRVRC